MNVGEWLVFGVLSTLVLTTLGSAAQGLGLTRISLTYLLGTMFTPNRSRAKLVGFFAHLVVGQLFLLLYVAVFHLLDTATWWLGAAGGLLHALALLTVGVEILPGLHPRMASEDRGPTAAKRLEPPGFFALHYGPRTPLSIIVEHVVYGGLFGWLYSV